MDQLAADITEGPIVAIARQDLRQVGLPDVPLQAVVALVGDDQLAGPGRCALGGCIGAVGVAIDPLSFAADPVLLLEPIH